MKTHRSRGLTLVELMIGVSIVGILALLVASLGTRTFTLNRESRTGMQSQQDMAFALSHFSEDVRKAVGIAHPPSAGAFSLKQPHGGGYRYVTYRFAAEKLQRGISDKSSVVPTSWVDVVDSTAFKVVDGGFSYFNREGQATVERDLMRRIDLSRLRVKSLATQEIREIPVISAFMREASQVRALEVPESGIRISNASSKNPKLTIGIRNAADTPVLIRHVAFAWSPESPEEKINGKGTTFSLGSLSDQEPGELTKDVVIPAGAEITLGIDFKFANQFDLPAKLTVTMHAPSPSGRGRPYVMFVTVLPKHGY